MMTDNFLDKYRSFGGEDNVQQSHYQPVIKIQCSPRINFVAINLGVQQTIS